tara:strand:+ start:2931 stop:3089 length:159 start_codon:yes stop_codon:yes gene_type:complete
MEHILGLNSTFCFNLLLIGQQELQMNHTKFQKKADEFRTKIEDAQQLSSSHQ